MSGTPDTPSMLDEPLGYIDLDEQHKCPHLIHKGLGCAVCDPGSTTRQLPEILDACCGGRHWWWDKDHPLAVYMDKRVAHKGSVGELTGRPEWNPNWSCEPTVLGDFRSMPFSDGAFQLVVFDPPHIVRDKQPPGGINGLKYGALPSDTEQEDLKRGFSECWRVLRPGGTLVFKWAGSLDRVEPHFPSTPIVGSRNAPRGSKGLGTRWFVFYKALHSDITEVRVVRGL